MSRPILPARIAVDSLIEIKGFVAALLQARRLDTSEAVLRCLFEDEPMVKGPFLSLELPFRSVQADQQEWPLDPALKEDFDPYIHQMKAFERLSGDHPAHTLVTTGTGSGKSECFILPIMDYVLQCKRSGQRDGVKALILYPMNALIEDQGERLSKLANQLNADLPEDQQIRVGRYTGAAGHIKAHNPAQPKLIIDDRDTLCHQPPDILLTNYKMLDFMLFRPEEQQFWNQATQEVFQYLVLDELHTFDGAQGADVACLLRRLRLKLEREFTCVGTSATVAAATGDDPEGGRGQGQKELANFATTLFGTTIGPEAIIGEERLTADEYLHVDANFSIPETPAATPTDLLFAGRNGYAAYLDEICARWQAPVDNVERGQWIRAHPLSRQLIDLDLTGKTLADITTELGIDDRLLVEYLDLLASARIKKGDRESAVLPLSTQIWVTESNYLLRRLGPEPSFKRADGTAEPEYFPAVNCHNCGLSGWYTILTEGYLEDNSWHLETDPKALFDKFFVGEGVVLFPRYGQSESSDESQHYCYDLESSLLFQRSYLDGSSFLPLKAAFLDTQTQTEHVGQPKKKKAKDFRRCPDCDHALSLRLSTISRSMIGSVLSGTFLAHGANPDDRKLLLFNDSVQDTAHQAGYISARSYRFNLRRFLYQRLQSHGPGQTNESIGLADLHELTRQYCHDLWQKARNEQRPSENDATASRQLMQIIPRDLWEFWKFRSHQNPLHSERNLLELIERLSWEFWLELTVQRNLGWSLRKSELIQLQPKEAAVKTWLDHLERSILKVGLPAMERPKDFVLGLMERLISYGVIYHPDLKACYQKAHYNFWPLRNQKPHLAGLFGHNSAQPHILNAEGKGAASKKRLPIHHIYSKNGDNWYIQWVKKHLPADQGHGKAGKIMQFLDHYLTDLVVHKAGLKTLHEEAPKRFVLDPKALEISLNPPSLYHCEQCAHLSYRSAGLSADEPSCEQYRCQGRLTAISPEFHQQLAHFSGFLKRQYQRDIEAPLAHTHTGGLKADERRIVEQAFKRGLLPGQSLNESGEGAPYFRDHPINVLACSPTLEMGIDIGSLSGVTLRGFPRNLASARQRLGRSGRKSGNAFNMILAGRGAHDRYYWQNSMLFFGGEIEAPGCRFRTKHFVRRQFHAYLLDSYVGQQPHLVFPSEKTLPKGHTFSDHPFWTGFHQFLTNCEPDQQIRPFLDAIKLGQVDEEISYPELAAELRKSFDLKDLWAKIAEILRYQDDQRLRADEEQQSLEQALESQEDYENTSHNAEAIDLDQKSQALKLKQSRLGGSDYTLSVLASEGLLPNYAFPEEGIYFRCTSTLLVDRNATTWRKKFKTLKEEISRPADPGLRELAPGNSYYIKSMKAPITRIHKDEEFLQSALICDSCGHLTEAKKESGCCPICGDSDKATLVQLLEPREVLSTGDFTEMQIRDNDDERDKGRTRIEPFINFHEQSPSSPGHQATWTSPSQRLSFEFRVQATIHFVVRGASKTKGGFTLCQECWAVPIRRDEKDIPQFHINGKGNRHDPKCPYYREKDHNPPTLDVVLGKKIQSDTIRFAADSIDTLPSLQALLMLAMRLLLKGQPQHLKVTATFLNTSTNGHQIVATLYDTVPGGTGHLRSLMPMEEEQITRTSSGLSRLQTLFDETLRYLKQCPCQTGCYNCLLRYDNQFQHEQIDKKIAIDWLANFIMADDWGVEHRSIDTVMVHDELFDSRLEEWFFDCLCQTEPPILGIKKTTPDRKAIRQRLDYRTVADAQGYVEHTPQTRVFLKGEIPHTKPDFTVHHEKQLAAYIYLDGAKHHLTPGRESSQFFEVDVPARNALWNKLKSSHDTFAGVFSFTYDMIETWYNWSKRERTREDYQTMEPHRLVSTKNRSPKQHLLILYLLYRFGKNQAFLKDIDSKEPPENWLRNLYIPFVTLSLARICHSSQELFMSPKDVQLLKKVAQNAEAFEAGKRFGGLVFRRSADEFFWEMDDSREYRVDGSGRLRKDYLESWSLFWMLWSIDRQLVRLKKTSQPSTSVKPSGYSYCVNQLQRDVADRLIDEGISISLYHSLDFLDDLEVGPQFLWVEPRHLFAFREQLNLSDKEINESLAPRCNLILLETNQGVDDIVAIIKSALGGKAT
jgi:DEAD/DEAH box helicase domain-containing protein